MYDKLNITENHLGVLSIFSQGFNKEYYIREVAVLLDLSPRTAQLILDDCESKTILESTVRGKIKVYSLKRTIECMRYLVLAEQHRAIAFLSKRQKLNALMKGLVPLVNGILLVFGSHAKGLEKKDSDIDLFVIGTCNAAEMRKLASKYGLKLDIKSSSPEKFSELLGKDILITEVLEHHVAVFGAELLVRLVMQNGKDGLVL